MKLTIFPSHTSIFFPNKTTTIILIILKVTSTLAMFFYANTQNFHSWMQICNLFLKEANVILHANTYSFQKRANLILYAKA